MARIDRPVTVHGIRHTVYDLPRQQGVRDAVVKAMVAGLGRTLRRAASTSTCTTAEG